MWQREREKESGNLGVCVCGSRKAEQLSPESRLSHKLNARLTAVNGTSEKLLLFGCSTLYSTQRPLFPSLWCSLWQPLTHSTTQHLLSSGSSECFGPRVRKSISFMFFCWNFMGDRSSFSFFFQARERKREWARGRWDRWTVQLGRISFDNAAVFWDRAGRGAKLDSAEATELPFSAQKLIWYSLSVTESHIMKIRRAGLLDAAADKLYKDMEIVKWWRSLNRLCLNGN